MYTVVECVCVYIKVEPSRSLALSIFLFRYFRCHSLINLLMCVSVCVRFENVLWLGQFNTVSMGYWCLTVVEQRCARSRAHTKQQ